MQNTTAGSNEGAENYVSQPSNHGSLDASEYDEIDQIYDYIRGVGSLPKNMNFNSCNDQIDVIAAAAPAQSHRGSQKTLRDKKVANLRGFNKVDIAGGTVSSKYGHFHVANENPSMQWIKHNYIEKSIPASIRTIPSKLKQNVSRRPALIVGKTNISTGQKVSTSLQDCHQSPLFDIR